MGWKQKPLAHADDALMVTSCGYCSASVEDTLEGGRAWFAEHRQQVHPELATPGPRPPRRRSPSVPGFRNRAAEAASGEGPD